MTGIGKPHYALRAGIAKAIVLVLFLLLALVTFFPFFMMVIESTHNSKEILTTPPPLTVGSRFIGNYGKIFDIVPFWRNFFNSLVIASAITALSLVFCAMGGYAFAMYDFPLKNLIFAILLGTMMLPWLVDMVPWFIIMSRLHLRNTYAALILPGMVSAFGIFWMRQYIASNIPPALLDAARIDGCPESLLFFRIVAPLLAPAFGALGIMNFLGSWNNFFFPMLVLTKKEMMTLPLAISMLSADPRRGMDYGIVMTATTLMLVPVLAVFWLASRRFIAGMTAGAVKG